MSDRNLEQRINIKFGVKIGKSASETVVLLTVGYSKYVIGKLSVFESHRRIKEWRENMLDDPRNGQPQIQRTDANVERVRTLVLSDRRLGVRVKAEELNMNRETVFGGEVKSSVPCRRFAACKKKIPKFTWKSEFKQNYRTNSRPQFHLSLLGSLASLRTYRHLAAKMGTSKGGGKQ